MIHGSAIHIAYRILAAFFIDMGAKTSIVENLELFNQLNGLWDLTQAAGPGASAAGPR